MRVTERKERGDVFVVLVDSRKETDMRVEVMHKQESRTDSKGDIALSQLQENPIKRCREKILFLSSSVSEFDRFLLCSLSPPTSYTSSCVSRIK
jgi:hypothetical protein